MKSIAIEAKQDTGTKDAAGKVVYKSIAGTCNQYESVAEAVKTMEGGEKTVLAIVNMHVKIRALDALRKGSSVSVGKLYKAASPEAQAKINALLGIKK